MNKKAQITLFIIIGIVLIILVGLTLFSVGNINKSETKVEVGESASLKSFVEDCIKEVAIPALYLQGLQGGYIYSIDDSFVRQGSDYSISYLYNAGKTNVPTREKLQSEINKYINQNLNYCLDNFILYREKGYSIRVGKINTDSTVAINEVFIKVTYPVSLTKNDKTEAIDEFSTSIPVRLGYLNDISTEFINAVVQDPSKIDMTMLGRFDVNVTIIPYNQDTILYSFYDEKSNIKEKRYLFLFATKI